MPLSGSLLTQTNQSTGGLDLPTGILNSSPTDRTQTFSKDDILMSLTLSRKPGQSIRVGNEVFTTMVRCSRGEPPIFIDAPKQEQIVHGETEETGGHPDSRRDRRSRASRARRLKRCARHRRGYRKSRTAVGFIRPCKAAMPRALPPLELRRDALAFAIRRRRRGDSDSAGAAVLA